MLTRICGLVGVALLAVSLGGCHPHEGERCNPLLFTDECSSGLSCIYPVNCGVAYCCPPADKQSSEPNCQPCPAPDAGTGADAATH